MNKESHISKHGNAYPLTAHDSRFVLSPVVTAAFGRKHDNFTFSIKDKINRFVF